MDFFAILDYVVSLIEDVWAAFVNVINEVLQFIVDAASFIWNALVAVWQWLGTVWGALKDFFDDLWWQVITPFVEWVQRIVDDITTWLANFLDPLITFIQRLMDWYTKHIFPIISKILEVLQRVRVFLALFKLLGVKWAAKLDADIQRLQGYITTALTDVVATLNTVSTLLNVLIDPGQIIRKDFFTGTLFSSLGAVKRATAFGSGRALTPNEQASEDGNKALLDGGTNVLTHNADGSVTFSGAAQSQNDAFKAAVDYYKLPSGTP